MPHILLLPVDLNSQLWYTTPLMSNPCVKCGKERIDGKSWESKVGISVIVHTMTVCPDKECQKQVDQSIAERKAKAVSIQKAKEEAKLAREKLLAV